MATQIEPQADGVIEVFDPNTGEVVGTVREQTSEEVEAAVARARVAAQRWGAMSHDERRRDLVTWRRGLAHRVDELCELVHRENGKPRADAMAEFVGSMGHLTHAANRAKKVLATRSVSSSVMPNFKSSVTYHPLGVVGVIGPWNYPIITPMGSIAYALAAGNTVVFKPSELTPLVAQLMAEIAAETISVPDVFQVITGRGATGAALVGAGVDKISFTGSAATGRKVMRAAAETLTPVLLELGGNDPLIVQADADLERAADAAVYGAFTNAGQACVSIERVYVESPVYDRFVDMVVDEAKAVKVGEDNAQIGAITLPGQVDIIRRHLEDAIAKGAKVLLGGPDQIEGNKVQPTVLVDVTEDMLVMKEETFGPVLPIVKVRDADEAVRLANDTGFGLGSAIFGKDGVRRRAGEIESGMTAINAVQSFSANPNLPFGGIGESGFGRIHGDEGLLAFSRPKAISERRFPGPLDVMTFKVPGNLYDKLKGMVLQMYGGGLVDRATDALHRLRR